MMQLLSHNLDSDSKNQDCNAQAFKRPFAIRSKHRLDIFTNITNYKKSFTIHKGAQFSTQRLALGNQRFLVRVMLVAMCRGVASAVIFRLISKCRGSGWKWQRVEDICNFFDSTKLKIVWKKITIFLKRRVSIIHVSIIRRVSVPLTPFCLCLFFFFCFLHFSFIYYFHYPYANYWHLLLS